MSRVSEEERWMRRLRVMRARLAAACEEEEVEEGSARSSG